MGVSALFKVLPFALQKLPFCAKKKKKIFKFYLVWFALHFLQMPKYFHSILIRAAGRRPTKPKSSPSPAISLFIFHRLVVVVVFFQKFPPPFFLHFFLLLFLAALQQIFWQKCGKNVSEMRFNSKEHPLFHARRAAPHPAPFYTIISHTTCPLLFLHF